MQISQTIRRYHAQEGEHARHRSWEHCYGHFQRVGPDGVLADPSQAALHLAFYLASWGMYRGSSFLLQYAYAVHVPFVTELASGRFKSSWGIDLGSDTADANRIPQILQLLGAVRRIYTPFARKMGSHSPSDTLVTKILLGTLGCVPACDQFFLKGIRGQIKHSGLNERFLRGVFGFCQAHLKELRKQQSRLASRSSTYYPLMKLVDMYFWQLGLEMERARRATTPAE